MKLCWNGEGQKYYDVIPVDGRSGNFTFRTANALSLSWWQNYVPKLKEFRSRYILQSRKNDTAVPGRHRNTILLNIEVKGYTLYAGKEKGI